MQDPQQSTRTGRSEYRRKRRKRRVVRGLVRLVFWTLVLAGVFIMGIGFGKTVGGDGDGTSSQVTVEDDLGQVTATLPTKTVVQTKTVVRRVPARRRP